MKKIINISNMTCEHCSAHVKEALENLNEVCDVKVSLFRKRAVVEGENLSDDILKNAVETAGYTVTSIEWQL